jgi:hypothetical protein
MIVEGHGFLQILPRRATGQIRCTRLRRQGEENIFHQREDAGKMLNQSF